MRRNRTARLLDAVATAHEAEAAGLRGKKARRQRDLARQARARADRIDGPACATRGPAASATDKRRDAVPACKVERLHARPCLSPEEEAAILDHLMHEEDEIVRMPPPGTPFTLIEVEPPPRGTSLSDALYRTAEAMRRAGVLDRVLARGLGAGRKARPR